MQRNSRVWEECFGCRRRVRLQGLALDIAAKVDMTERQTVAHTYSSTRSVGLDASPWTLIFPGHGAAESIELT